MKISNGLVIISPGDSLVGVTLKGVEVRLEVDREINSARFDDDVLSILESMDVAMQGTRITDCRVTTTGRMAREAAQRAISAAQAKPERQTIDSALKRFVASLPWPRGGSK